MKTFMAMLSSKDAVSAAEYALVLAIVGSAIAVAAATLGGSISNSMSGMSNRLAECGEGSC
jgi:pilus assembly protein Flp/PilA